MLQKLKKMRYRHSEVKSRALTATNLGGSPEETLFVVVFILRSGLKGWGEYEGMRQKRRGEGEESGFRLM